VFNFCSQYNNVRYVDVIWGQGSLYPDTMGFFANNDIVVLRVKVPTSPSNYSLNAFSASVSEYQGSPTFRQLVLSRSPCDFNRVLDHTGLNGPLASGSGNTVSAVSTVGVGQPMVPGESYYASLRNFYQDIGVTCNTEYCNAIVGFQWPR
jgi:hypothetical protein